MIYVLEYILLWLAFTPKCHFNYTSGTSLYLPAILGRGASNTSKSCSQTLFIMMPLIFPQVLFLILFSLLNDKVTLTLLRVDPLLQYLLLKLVKLGLTSTSFDCSTAPKCHCKLLYTSWVLYLERIPSQVLASAYLCDCDITGHNMIHYKCGLEA